MAILLETKIYVLLRHLSCGDGVIATCMISTTEGWALNPSKSILQPSFNVRWFVLSYRNGASVCLATVLVENVFWWEYIGMGFRFLFKIWLNFKVFRSTSHLESLPLGRRETIGGVGSGKFGRKSDIALLICHADLEVHGGWEGCLVEHEVGLRKCLQICSMRVMSRLVEDDVYRMGWTTREVWVWNLWENCRLLVAMSGRQSLKGV